MHWPHAAQIQIQHITHHQRQRQHTISPLLSIQAPRAHHHQSSFIRMPALPLCSPCLLMSVTHAHEATIQLPSATTVGTQQQQRSTAPSASTAAATTLNSAAATRLPMPVSTSSTSTTSMQSSSSTTPASDSATTKAATSTATAYSNRKKQKQDMGLRHMFAGSVAGMVSKTMLQPLDLVKVRLQVQDGSGANEYRGIMHAIRSIVQSEGAKGLYKGLTPNLAASGLSWGVYFFSYNLFKDLFKARLYRSQQSQLTELQKQQQWATQQAAALALQRSSAQSGSDPPPQPQFEHSHVRLGPLTHLFCAAGSGMLATTITNPITMIKTRLQLEGQELGKDAKSAYKGPMDCAHRIIRDEGFLSLYRGLGPSLILVGNGALQFMAYEELKKWTIAHLCPSHSEKELTSVQYFCMGGLAKVFSATATYPFALTRSRLYARSKPIAIPAVVQHLAQPAKAALASATAATALTAAAAVKASVGAAGVSAAPIVKAAQSLSAAVAPKAASAPKQDVSRHVREAKYTGMLDVFRKTLAAEGWRGFYRGLTVQLLKTAPSSAITFCIYETVIKAIDAQQYATQRAIAKRQQTQQNQ